MPTAPPANSTWAMGMPVAMLFFEPPNSRVMRSSWFSPTRRPMNSTSTSTSARNSVQTSVRTSRRASGICSQSPPITAALKAV